MTSNLMDLVEAIDLLRASDGFRLTESKGVVHLSATPSNEAAEKLQEIAVGDLEISIRAEYDERSIEISEIGGKSVKLYLSFEYDAARPRAITPEGWHSVLKDDRVSFEEVRLAFYNKPFATSAFQVVPWDCVLAEKPLTGTRRVINPQRTVRDLTHRSTVPSSIEKWIETCVPAGYDLAFDIWSCVAVEKSIACLPSEIYLEDGVEMVVLAGASTRRIPLKSGHGERPMPLESGHGERPMLETLQTACRWVYIEGDDHETRHTFLVAELAREWKEGCSFYDGLVSRLCGALESARIAYKAHLRSSSKETIRALSDLRKALSEDVGRILNQTRELSGSLWRDAALVLGAFGVRVLGSASHDGGGYAIVYVLLAIYVSVSHFHARRLNGEFFELADRARDVWRRKIFTFLDAADYDALVTKPISDATTAYRTVLRRVDTVIATLVVFLVIGASWEARELLLRIGATAFETLTDVVSNTRLRW